ncbi:hypothetical protein [Amycolatopsis sp. PS_44_ISF1]|uniref:hypothetical protein n=1 Tax=Amycolatopsis sp. PS_44_ISF1 TaxID=2974917 RepID=UPI0028DF65B9|nr:hypothetical protein [Amycolatopsis sp. PS_44_ISF1]MDT8913396.1 hypothetical protein [Amycolatopsis sp. PS_44_ISF1]
MTSRKWLMPYPPARSLEDAAFGEGLAPNRIFRLLLPVWQVDVQATITDGEPYELIDRYLERGIAEAGLGTAAELSRFFALDEPLVLGAIRFLYAIGHVVEGRDGRLALTELGRASHRDRVSYRRPRQDRRKMYFDAFESAPFTRGYYDAGTVSFLKHGDLGARPAGRSGENFVLLSSTHGFRREALTELVRRTDRDRFNLPIRIDNPESLGEECVHLPLYVVRASERGNRIRYLAYSQASDEHDPELSALCQRRAEIAGVIENEIQDDSADWRAERASEWLRRQDLEGHRAQLLADGTWRVRLPPEAFAPNGPVALDKLGSFTVLKTDLLHIWCEDESTRELAHLERVGGCFGNRGRLPGGEIESRISRLARQLQVKQDTVPATQNLASERGRERLATQLAEYQRTKE